MDTYLLFTVIRVNFPMMHGVDVVHRNREPPLSINQLTLSDPNYSGQCIPISSRDLDCADVGKNIKVTGSDPHGFDRDGDGIGCEG